MKKDANYLIISKLNNIYRNYQHPFSNNINNLLAISGNFHPVYNIVANV